MKHRKPKGKLKFTYQILHEDKDIIVINKPAGLLTVPIPKIKAINLEDLLNDRFDASRRSIQAAHRIDRFTTGVVVFARTRTAHKNLVAQFRAHTPERIYLALVRGCPKDKEGELCHHMKRISEGFRNIIVPESDPESTEAKLRYVVLSPGKEISLVKIFLQTGLKNQIRVQFKELGHPLVGDQHYNKHEKQRDELQRQALHAAELGFIHPGTNQKVHYIADLPVDMKRLI